MPQLPSRAQAVAALVAATVVFLLLSSCATAPHAFTSDPLAILGANESWYAVVPVSQNTVLLEEIAHTVDDSHSIKKILNRTNRIYLSGNFLPDEQAGFLPYKLLATGSYPKSMAGIAFSSKKGWEKQDAAFGSAWYKNNYLGAAIPRNGLACMSDSALMPSMLENIHRSFLPPVAVDPSFHASVAQSETNSQITVFVSDGQYLLQRILGSNITFAVQHILITARPSRDSNDYDYCVGIRITLADERTVRALAALFRLAVDLPVKIEDTSLIVDNQNMRAKDLAHLLNFLYF